MSKWPGKYLIGLTGNIATGKSVVRKMLERLGAFGIDADALAHRAISQGSLGYQPVIEMFGRWVLAPDQQIDRGRLGRVVFADPAALKILEDIVHPLVDQSIDLITRRASQPIVVIEAIKLIEANLHKNCDALWVTYTPADVQLARLTRNRHIAEEDARRRIAAQPPQETKIALANIMIKNEGSLEDTWQQVSTAWQKTVPTAAQPASIKAAAGVPGGLTIERGRPDQARDIAALITRLASDPRPRPADEMLAAFGEKTFLLLQRDQMLVGVVSWQVENLVARITDLYIEPSIVLTEAMPLLFSEIERAAGDLQCEAALVFVPPAPFQNDAVWKKLGYERRQPESLGFQAWQEAAIESSVPGSVMLFKQLRRDRILSPI